MKKETKPHYPEDIVFSIYGGREENVEIRLRYKTLFAGIFQGGGADDTAFSVLFC